MRERYTGKSNWSKFASHDLTERWDSHKGLNDLLLLLFCFFLDYIFNEGQCWLTNIKTGECSLLFGTYVDHNLSLTCTICFLFFFFVFLGIFLYKSIKLKKNLVSNSQNADISYIKFVQLQLCAFWMQDSESCIMKWLKHHKQPVISNLHSCQYYIKLGPQTSLTGACVIIIYFYLSNVLLKYNSFKVLHRWSHLYDSIYNSKATHYLEKWSEMCVQDSQRSS